MSVGDSILETNAVIEKEVRRQRGARLLPDEMTSDQRPDGYRAQAQETLVMECSELRKQQMEEP